MRFEEIRDQDLPVSILKRALERGRVPAAYLFTGPEGCGRTMAAAATAASLNCASGPVACGACPSCHLYETGNHPDFCRVAPAEGKRFIEIRQVREQVIARACLKPMKGRTSTFVIEGAHLFHPNAANAFLKTLEEPSETSRFILIAPRRESVLPTIASRCQVLAFKPLARETLKDLLEKQGTSPEEAALLSVMAEGSFKKALRLKEEGASRGIEGELGRVHSLPSLGPGKILDLSQRWSRNRQDAIRTLELLGQWYRDALFLAEGANPDQVLTVSHIPALMETAAKVPSQDLAAVCETIEDARDALEANTNIQLTLDRLLFSVWERTASREKRA